MTRYDDEGRPVPIFDISTKVFPVEGDEFVIDEGTTLIIVPEATIDFYSLETGRNLGTLIGKGIRLVGTSTPHTLKYRVVSVTYENKETQP